MTFDLSADQEAARAAAHAFAVARVAPHAEDTDRGSAAPPETVREATELLDRCGDAIARVAVLEEIAVASGAIAVAAAAGSSPRGAGGALSGLRGARWPEESPRAHLALAAVALGLGRAALDHALAELRRTTARPQEGREKPHWIVADAATELEASRLMTRAAAQALDEGDATAQVAMARLMASASARLSVDAALRISGPDGYRDGTLLERLARDVRAISLVLGTEEQHRATAGERLLPG
jgi:alkylation response protein AidB-like acyl-CoA dehydrogenase